MWEAGKELKNRISGLLPGYWLPCDKPWHCHWTPPFYLLSWIIERMSRGNGPGKPTGPPPPDRKEDLL